MAKKEVWLGPPRTGKLKALRVTNGVDRKGKFKWKDVPQTKKDKKRRAKFEAEMKKNDKKGIW